MTSKDEKERPPTSGVLAAIERITGEAPRLELVGESEAPGGAPVLEQDVPKSHGTFRLIGEIAHGGMGAVLRARDDDLGRDVAIKVLHRELARRPDSVQRFIEEAQIGGQLQHPGIVPVYELGLTADERPYFTMKLVKGRTLADVLGARKAPSDERRRLLDVFVSVCQTIAYAHSRGVIHRDLNPSNILVGSFGEVQIVDWGLAKVMPRIELAKDGTTSIQTVRTNLAATEAHTTKAGSLMGTIAYLSPEQARGQVDRVDRRADVFSLGAILCEILTGKPPYVGDVEVTLIKAGNGELDDAHQRLKECGADPDVIALARDCLSRKPEKRPRDAAAVAERVQGFLTAVEERARQARVEIEAIRTQATRERRVLWAVAATSAILAGALIWSAWPSADEPAPAPERAAEARVFREALARYPNDAHLHQLLGAALAEQGDLEGAIASYRRALDFDPANAEIVKALQDLEQRRGH